MDKNADLQKLLSSPIPEIRTAAQQAVSLNGKLSRKEISYSEYVELMDDISRLDRIDKAMFKEEVFIAIKKAYEIIKAVRMLSPSF